MSDDVMELLARNELGILTAEDLVTWGTRVLAAKGDVPALVRLAGLDLDSTPRVADAMPVFLTALEQLDVRVSFGRDELLRAHLRFLATKMAAGQLSLSEGLARVEREVLTPLGHPEDLMPWCYVASEIHPETLRDLSGRWPREKWEAYVLELAKTTSERSTAAEQ